MTVPHKGRGWRLAGCLIAMEAEADRIAPNRNRASDGSIGDQNHQARKSDHNPDGDLTVDALDLTHSPERGWDTHARARQVAQNVKNGIEPRIKYIISNGQIFSKENGVWAWREYDGPNPHDHHAHYSIEDAHQDDTSPWFLGVPAFPTTPTPPPYVPPPAPSPADLLTIQRLLQEDDDMVIIRDGKGIALLVNGKCVGQTAESLAQLRKEYAEANRPLVVHRCRNDDEWFAFGGWR